MTANAAELLRVARRLDDFPMGLLNGGASDASRALAASESEAEAVAVSRGIDCATVRGLWERADVCLRETPRDDDAVFSRAAELASLLYTAGWMLESSSATTDDLKALL
ncbi:MAG: hypothetical protein WBQ14_08210 [Gaiellaceae bacterium]